MTSNIATRTLSTMVAGSLLLLATPQAALAEEPAYSPNSDRGWYIRVIGGLGWLGDTDVTGAGSGQVTYDPGFGAGLSGGYDFGRWRLETEYLYQTNDADEFSLDALSGNLASLGGEVSGGDFSSVVISANLVGELNLLGSERAKSYAGVGLAWVQEVDIDINTSDGERSFSTDDIGFQVFAGVEYAMGPRWSASLEARYLAVGALDLDDEGQSSDTLSADYDRTSVLLGLSYRF